MQDKSLSVIIPTLNEEGNISELARRLHAVLSADGIDYEMIFIDDHSSDNTREIIGELKRAYPIRLYKKQGRRGKAYSIMEGFRYATKHFIAFIDADLQYPPEAIPDMLAELYQGKDIMVARRIERDVSLKRKIASKAYHFAFSKLLHGLDCDAQAGLKVFKRRVAEEVKLNPTPWTFDLEFLINAKNYGYVIGSHDIHFAERRAGDSKLSLRRAIFEIGLNALKLRFKARPPLLIHPESEDSMRGAGVAHKKKRFITHTTLRHSESALNTFVPWQTALLAATLAIAIFGLLYCPWLLLKVIIAALTLIYFFDMFFYLFLVRRSLKNPPEIKSGWKELKSLKDEDLPMYTIFCPMYKEANVLLNFVEAISRLKWPKHRLDVQLLLEENDLETIEAARSLDLPDYFRIIVVPHSEPKTKPKACNYGLSLARGEYAVIYDAEDVPDPWQLKKAYLGFMKLPADVGCLQAKLNYYNSGQNLLTRLFTAEYSLWFDVALPGLQTINTALPLGGTSNHFRVRDLRDLEGWDPFNVTEDCDLGIRIFNRKFKTAIIDSTTLEEANSKVGNWLRQRSRWIKGYLQTYFVNMRKPLKFIRENGVHGFLFQLIVGAKTAFIFVNPFLWLVTISYFLFRAQIGARIEALYPPHIYYLAVACLIFGNFIYLYNYMIGLAKRGHWSLVKYVFLVPIYWILMSIAGLIAVYQLFVKPHFWEKTRHGLHLGTPIPEPVSGFAPELLPSGLNLSILSKSKNKLIKLIKTEEGFFVGSIILANFINFVFSAYLGRALEFANLGLVSFINTVWYVAMIFIAAYGTTINYRSAYLSTSRNEEAGASFLYSAMLRGLKIILSFSVVWLVAIPFLTGFFNISNSLILLLISPMFPFGILLYANLSYLKGTLRFRSAAYILLCEAGSKLILAAALVSLGLSNLVFISIPASVVLTGLLAIFIIRKQVPKIRKIQKFNFPRRFFSSSFISNISSIAFLSLDMILAKHFLSPVMAGEYALLSLIGKMIYFGGMLPNQFTMTFISRSEGEKKDPGAIFRRIFTATLFLVACGIMVLGFFGWFTTPVLFGSKVKAITSYLPIYTIAIGLYALTGVMVSYHLARRRYYFTVVSALFSLVMILGIIFFHNTLADFVFIIFITSVLAFLAIGSLHLIGDWTFIIRRNIKDFFDVFFGKIPLGATARPGKNRILIFNWRDLKHKFAGGAEMYIQELAKNWVKQGHQVTIFCGNDAHCPRSEVIDGVAIIRRGGFYLVYVWAFFYYLFRFRKKYDFIIDCQNGVPFFTPVYASEPVYCLMHHVHQEVFRKSLIKPLAWLAIFLEKTIMPLVYANIKFITVSKSSRQEISGLGLGRAGIEVVNPGIDLEFLQPGEKSPFPLILYFGRLKEYKSIDILIKAYKLVLDKIPGARLVVAGSGEEQGNLKRVAHLLGLKDKVFFTGRVPDDFKRRLLQGAWVAVNPSLMEGWGITTIEANACGTPVVASNVPGLKDSVRNPHTGFLVDYGDVAGFAARIIEILKDDSLRKKLSVTAAQWAKNFNWEKNSENFLNYVKEDYKLKIMDHNFLEAFEKSSKYN